MTLERIPPYDYYRNNRHTLESIYDTIRGLVESEPKTIVSKSGQQCEVIRDGYLSNNGASFEKGARHLIELETTYRQAWQTDETSRLAALGVSGNEAIQQAAETYHPPLAGYFKEGEFVQRQQIVKLSHTFLLDHQSRACIASTHMQFPHDEFSHRNISITRFNALPIDARSELFTSARVDFIMPHIIRQPEDKLAIWHALYDRTTTPEQLDKVITEIFHPFFQTGWHPMAAASADSVREHFKKIREIDQIHQQTGYGLVHPPRHELDKIQICLNALQA